MTNRLTAAALSLLMAAAVHAAPTGTWKAYLAYHDIQQIRAAGNDIFVMASNALYQYNTTDNSITTYDKVNGLSDTRITNIAWNKSVRRLIAVYENSNIDLVETDGDVVNISDLYNKTMTEDKTVNSVTVYGKHAYLSTNFGVVKVNMADAEISETYILGFAVSKTALSGGSIYVLRSDNAVWQAPLSDNLIDKNNWKPSQDYPQGIFDEDNSDYEKYYQTVSELRPGGPDYNYMGFLMFRNGKLYTANGPSGIEDKGCLQVFDGNEWTVYENDIEDKIGHRFVNLMSCDVDPADENHVFAGGQTGLYEYRDGKFVREYSVGTSPLQIAATVVDRTDISWEQKICYVLVNSVKFDKNGHLWLTNSTSKTTSLLELTPEGEWISHHDSKLIIPDMKYGMEAMSGLMFDSRGLMWFANGYFRSPAVIRYTPSENRINTYYQNITNQDGTSLTIDYSKEVTEDREGNLWFATNTGPLYITPSQITSNEDIKVFNQFKVPRNDGTIYADYLLANIQISSIAIDGANRKWFGTDGNGVYLVSADNMTEIHHFTTENSKLLSDNVRDIAIDGRTGEVFFGTDKGLCSYMSDATTPNDEMDKDNVYAYPNPVTPEYTGLITVTGLSFNADVKITTATGALVSEGRSNGGTFTWDGHDSRGERVASGIYNVVTAKSDGSKGTVCKIAIIR